MLLHCDGVVSGLPTIHELGSVPWSQERLSLPIAALRERVVLQELWSTLENIRIGLTDVARPIQVCIRLIASYFDGGDGVGMSNVATSRH